MIANPKAATPDAASNITFAQYQCGLRDLSTSARVPYLLRTTILALRSAPRASMSSHMPPARKNIEVAIFWLRASPRRAASAKATRTKRESQPMCRLFILPNAKDEPRPRLAPEAALPPKCQPWSLALAPCSAKTEREASEESQSPGRRREVEAILLCVCRSEVELPRSFACDAGRQRESAAGFEFQNAGAWEA